MRYIYYSSKFEKSLRKMPRFVKKAFLGKESLFVSNPFGASLETHKLHGKYKEYWAFTIVGQYRIMFKFANNERDVEFVNIGTHEIYR